MLRFFSLLLRRMQFRKDSKKLVRRFNQWKQEILEELPVAATQEKKLLIIRLDDIGDYLLFRNMLPLYRQQRWKDYEITLLGNEVWKELFEMGDHTAVDKSWWLSKKNYFQNQTYRAEIWKQIREAGFEAVICPSRTRPLLLDDMCMLAAGAQVNIAAANTFITAHWNKLSDDLYRQLYRTPDEHIHEFQFNLQFTNWVCGTNGILKRPEIGISGAAKTRRPYLLCFIGASVKSKRWPEKQWIGFIKLYQRQYGGLVIIAGGAGDKEAANRISAETGAESIAGTTSLREMVSYVCGASAVVTNDTMAVHIAASCNKPALIIANGNKYYRFTEFESLGVNNIVAIYPKAFTQKLHKAMGKLSEHYAAVTADISTIKAETAFKKFVDLMSTTGQ